MRGDTTEASTAVSDPPISAGSRRTAGLQVLIVAYGDPTGLDECLCSLSRAHPVLVVDNSSSSATRELAQRHAADYLDPGSNVGFAAGVNLGLAQLDLRTTDVLLVNPDATIDPDQIEVLRGKLDEASDIACVAPAQHAPGSSKPARVCWPFPTAFGAWEEAAGLGRFRRRWGYVIASVLLVRGAAIEDVGAFDEGFFLYAEEADWERRATRRGWRVAYAPEATAVHVGAATDPQPERRHLRFHAGVERYVRKWGGPIRWRSYQLATVLTAYRRAASSRGERRSSAMDLAHLYARGPYAAARAADAIPERVHGVPALARSAERGAVSRVLLVDSIGYEELGGAATVLNEVIEHVDRSRFVPVLACLSRGRWPEQVRARGTAAYSIDRSRLRSLRNLASVILALRRIIRFERIDLIHASENTTLPYASIAGALTRTPVVWHIHSPLRARTREEKIVARLLRRLQPAYVVFTSSGARARTMPIARCASTVIHPGVDLARCRSGDRSRGRHAVGVPDGARMISMISRIEPMKGAADFVRCMCLLAPRYPDLYAVMCGPGDREGAYWRSLDDAVREHDLFERLLMPGDVRTPLKEDLVAASDVVVHPSHAESFGLAVLEAMAAGKPVVAADTDGPRLLMEDGRSGVIVPVGDPGALSEAVARLLEDPEARRRIGDEAARSADSYPVETMVRRVESLWSTVLGTENLRGSPSSAAAPT